jgi:hypothetical protein
MSNHLRHCPKHRKPLPCSHCALAAKPARAPEIVVEIVAEQPLLVPKKRGRPPKHGTAMTPAERKTVSRANQKTKQDDTERRTIIVKLMKIYDRQAMDVIVIGHDSDAIKRAEDRKEIDRGQKRLYLEQLKTLSLDELQLAIEGKQTPDTHGRLHNERSGEDKREHGQSEIEQILATKQHDSSLFEDEDQDPHMAAGFRRAPIGSGADQFEAEDSMVDSADVRIGSAKPEHESTAGEKWIQKAIKNIVAKMNFEPDGARCPFCFQVFLTSGSAEYHLDDQYALGEKDMERHLEHRYLIAVMNSHPSMPGGGVSTFMEPLTAPYVHYKLINEEIEVVRKQARKKPERKTA